MRLIDADALRFSSGYNDDGILYVPYKDIVQAPTIDAEPVVHAHWIECGTEDVIYTCSNCKEDYVFLDSTPVDNGCKHCPNCGAKMMDEVDAKMDEVIE